MNPLNNDHDDIKGDLLFEQKWMATGNQFEYRVHLYENGIEAYFVKYRKKKRGKDPTKEYVHHPFIARHRFLNYERITGIYRVNRIEKSRAKKYYGFNLRFISTTGKNRYLIADTKINQDLEEINKMIQILERCYKDKWKSVYKADEPLIWSY